MIIVALNGGLGNQLFQYAFGRKLSIQNKQMLLLETSILDSDYLGRKLGIHNFNIQGKIVNNKVVRKIIAKNTKLNTFFKTLGLLKENIEKDFNYKQNLSVPSFQINFFNGFWQSYKYFEGIKKYLVKELIVTTDRLEKIKKEVKLDSSSICIHVRRKDYLEDVRYGFVGEDYYLRAVELMHENITDINFLVFSDDIEWCKKNLALNGKVTYISSKFKLTDWEELMLMTNCSHHIIANSSFSWWGAWLCTNPAQIVIRPAKPFKDPSLLYEYYYPTHWLASA